MHAQSTSNSCTCNFHVTSFFLNRCTQWVLHSLYIITLSLWWPYYSGVCSRFTQHSNRTSAPLSARLSNECCCTSPEIGTPICTHRTATHQLLWQQQHTCGAVGRSLMERGVGRQPYKIPHFHPRHCTHLLGMTLQRAWVWVNRLPTSVGRFQSCLYKWGMASSAACECGAEEQTVNNVILQCPIHRPPHGLQGLTVLDDKTTKWLLNTCPKI